MLKNKNQLWAGGKVYYAVLTGCLLLIIGVSAAIYNVSLNKIKPAETGNSSEYSYSLPSTTSRSQEQANMAATGIPKTSESTSATVSSKKLPYKGEFTPPVSGKVIGEFSNGEMVKNETMGDWRVHDGVDFAANDGESVVAVQDGEVESIDSDEMWGVCVKVLCPGGMTVKYCGLQEKPSVKRGDKVTKGSVIGKAGAIPIESSMPSHIHIETVIDKKNVNPLEAMNLL